jgi:hypothetical protein
MKSCLSFVGRKPALAASVMAFLLLGQSPAVADRPGGWGTPDPKPAPAAPAPPDEEASSPESAANTTFGYLTFTRPQGWEGKKQGGGRAFSHPRFGNRAGFLWHGPIASTDEPLLSQMAGALERFFPGKGTQGEQLQVHPMELPSGLKAVAVPRRYAQGKVLAVHVLIEAYDALHLYTVLAADPNQLKQLLDGELKLVLQTVKANVPTIEPVKPSGEVVIAERFFGRFSLLKDWKAADKRLPAHLGQYTHPMALPEGRVHEAPVLLHMAVGVPEDLEAAVHDFASGRLYYELIGKERERFHRYNVSVWQTASGRGSTIGLTHFRNKRFHANLTAHAFTVSGCTFFLGAAIQYEGLTKQQALMASKEFDALNVRLGQLITQAQVNLPPRQERWETFLKKKRTYGYFYERSTGSPSTVWAVKNHRNEWTFFEDGTCVFESNRWFGAMSNSHDDPGNPARTTGSAGGTREGRVGQDRSRFEVRGKAGGPLYLVTSPKDGNGSFHLLQPEIETTFGPFQPKGLAIDGLVEGTYTSGSGYQVYEAIK